MTVATLPPRREPVSAGLTPKPNAPSSVGTGAEQNPQQRLAPEELGREVPGNAATAWGFSMNVVCAWCEAPLGVKACRSDLANATSHGMCPVCYAKQLLPTICAEIERSSYDELLCLLLADGLGHLDDIAAKGVRELCRRRQQTLHYLDNKPADDLCNA